MKNLKRHILFYVLLAVCKSLLMAQNTQPKVMVASHRGDWRNYSENSIEAIEEIGRAHV